MMSTGRFESCLEIILQHEGGYVDHPADPGGATNLGITRKTLAAWRGISPWHELPKAAVRDLDRAEAAQIYRTRYWEACCADAVGAGLDLAVFDFAVNSGPGRAVKVLQAELSVTEDGILGAHTLAAIETYCKSRGATALVKALCARRRVFLKSLGQFETFGKGWLRRVAHVEERAVRDTATAPKIYQPERTIPMLDGYKTYIIAAAMIIAGLAQVLGVDLPALEGQAAGHLIFEALAVIFLRKGVKSQLAAA